MQFLRDCRDKKLFGHKETYFRLWSHPFFSPKVKRFTKNFDQIIAQIDGIVQELSGIARKSYRNLQNVDVLSYTLQLFRVYAKKELLSMQFEKITNASLSEQNIPQFLSELLQMSQEFQSLKKIYTTLWANTCSTANLQEIIINFNWMSEFYAEKSKQIQQKIAWKDPNIPSQWIYLCHQKKKGILLRTAFRKDFTLNNSFEKVIIQVICDTHCRVWVNGQLVKEFFSKRTLSVLMLNNSIQCVDITSKCKVGENFLTIENMNYQNGVGMVNVYGEISDASKKEILISDKTWIASNNPTEDWIKGKDTIQMKNIQTQNAMSLGQPPFFNGQLILPNFEKNLSSHHTLLLGMLNIGLQYTPLSVLWLYKWVAKMGVKKGLLY
jgi:hypothetical protein